MTSPRTQAIRFRIWQLCEPRGWNMTVPEIAEALDLPVASVSNIVKAAGWSNRVRASIRSGYENGAGPRDGMASISYAVARDVFEGRVNMEVLA